MIVTSSTSLFVSHALQRAPAWPCLDQHISRMILIDHVQDCAGAISVFPHIQLAKIQCRFLAEHKQHLFDALHSVRFVMF